MKLQAKQSQTFILYFAGEYVQWIILSDYNFYWNFEQFDSVLNTRVLSCVLLSCNKKSQCIIFSPRKCACQLAVDALGSRNNIFP